MQYCGTLHAPALQRLLLERTFDEPTAPFKPIPPQSLALFISKHLEIDAEMLPELSVDFAAGVCFQEEEDDGDGM